MKTRYQNEPQTFENIGYGKHYVNTNIHAVETEDGTQWECDQVTVDGDVTYPKVVVAMIRERYTEDDELALLRQHSVKGDEFSEYNDFCEACKATAKPLFGM